MIAAVTGRHSTPAQSKVAALGARLVRVQHSPTLGSQPTIDDATWAPAGTAAISPSFLQPGYHLDAL
ncbi:MAG: hypothetical protein A2V77_24550 [Anaeromyxobacter sp. RBG_16_69_14]|nr:MAG: hypothetical protein A2V77_24550 [Anaeromyxobacter sp. RBG_16_69_14]